MDAYFVTGCRHFSFLIYEGTRDAIVDWKYRKDPDNFFEKEEGRDGERED